MANAEAQRGRVMANADLRHILCYLEENALRCACCLGTGHNATTVAHNPACPIHAEVDLSTPYAQLGAVHVAMSVLYDMHGESVRDWGYWDTLSEWRDEFLDQLYRGLLEPLHAYQALAEGNTGE